MPPWLPEPGHAEFAEERRLTDAQIQQKLQAEDYTDIHITGRRYGDVYVTATKDGKTEKLAVKPQSGEVMPAPGDR